MLRERDSKAMGMKVIISSLFHSNCKKNEWKFSSEINDVEVFILRNLYDRFIIVFMSGY